MDNSVQICYGYIFFLKPKDKYFISKAEQEAMIKKWVSSNGTKCSEIYVDFWKYEISSDRPQFPQLLKRAEKGNIIVFPSIPSISRNLEDRQKVIEELKRREIRGVFVFENLDTTTITSEQIKNILPRDHLTVYGTEEKYAPIGRPPYGWKKMGEAGLVEVPEQQEVIKLIRKLKDEGQMSWYSIGQELTSKKVETPSGGWIWSGNTVKHIYDRSDQ
jgi:hypothetical protein